MDVKSRRSRPRNYQPVQPTSRGSSRRSHGSSTIRDDSPSRLFHFTLLVTLIVFRLLNAWIIRTTFVPDEVWQSVEVAHRWVYGYGALTWEWNSTVAIRSPLHPLIFAGIYKIMAHLGVDSRDAIVLAPRLFHGFIAGVTDFVVYLMALKLSGFASAKWVLFAEVTSWFTAYCGPRSLANSLEWSLHVIAFSHFPWPSTFRCLFPTNLIMPPSSPVPFLLHVCLSVIVRPTAAILWAPVCLHYLCRLWSEPSRHEFWSVFTTALTIGLTCLTVSLGIDRLVYGRWTVNQLNFLRFNFLSNAADFYGVQPWHWYLTNGLPTILLLHLPLSLIGWFWDATEGRFHLLTKPSNGGQALRERTVALYFGAWILWTVFAYSCLAHKEFRFLFSILPLFVYFTGRGLFHLQRGLEKLQWCSQTWCSPFRILVGFMVLLNASVAGYTCLVHQRGPDTLMAGLARQAEGAKWAEMAEKPSILVLMPCHTTPYLSYLHVNTSLRLLACDPDLSTWHGTDPKAHIDEADVFYDSPRRWFDEYLPLSPQPHYVAMFSQLIDDRRVGRTVLEWLEARGFAICAEVFHAHAVSHRRHSRRMLVWCAPGWNMDYAQMQEERILGFELL